MIKKNLPNLTLMVLVTSCFIQIGAQLFALSVVASTVAEAPPRSFAMLEGEYGYNSTTFWDIVPTITFVLLLIALVTNWKNQRRKLLLVAFTMFVAAGLLAGFFLEPVFAEMIARGYSDKVDPILQARSAKWLLLDWMVWGLGLITGLILLLALVSPVKTTERTTAGSSHLS